MQNVRSPRSDIRFLAGFMTFVEGAVPKEAGECRAIMVHRSSIQRHLERSLHHSCQLSGYGDLPATKRPWGAAKLSHRAIEDPLAERCVTVTRESIRLWCIKFGAIYSRRLKRKHGGYGDTFFIDEAFVRINGKQHFLGTHAVVSALPRSQDELARRMERGCRLRLEACFLSIGQLTCMVDSWGISAVQISLRMGK